MRVDSPPWFENNIYSTKSLHGVYKVDFTHSTTYSLQSNSKNWVLDPCWYRATSDPLDSAGLKSHDHLKAAVLQGRRARVVADGFSATTRVVYLLDDYVLFQSALYLFPREGIFAAHVGIAYQLTSTTGTKHECVHKQTNSRFLNLAKPGLVDHIDWFVESRTYMEIYRSDLEGSPLLGEASDVLIAASTGSDFQIVFDILDPSSEHPVTMSVTVDNAIISRNDWSEVFEMLWSLLQDWSEVFVEVGDLLYITTTASDYQVQEVGGHRECPKLNLLISSTRGLSGMVYTLGYESTQQVWPFGTPTDGGVIRWFRRLG
ncbi:hypothetical protein ElyMa_005515900 [Elysia marginata]|uniref:Uncharacterized protein n=1 Tax=Elysia marginata TaxID=1093978 RepID=A0AAV4EVC4_9GAST|nr:hypothetical protein ElyMa_005515900 [Elysia marginata]